MSRPSKLNARIQQELCQLLSAGVVIERASEKVGIAPATYYNWCKRGKDESARRDRPNVKSETALWNNEQPFFEFLEAVTRAISEAEVNATIVLRQGMLPQDVVTETTETVTETRLDKAGKPYQYTRTVARREVRHQPGDYRAAVEWLKRRSPRDWSEHTVLRGEGKEDSAPVPISIVEVRKDYGDRNSDAEGAAESPQS